MDCQEDLKMKLKECELRTMLLEKDLQEKSGLLMQQKQEIEAQKLEKISLIESYELELSQREKKFKESKAQELKVQETKFQKIMQKNAQDLLEKFQNDLEIYAQQSQQTIHSLHAQLEQSNDVKIIQMLLYFVFLL